MNSNFDKLMARLGAIEAQNAWMISALKQLLALEAGVELPEADELEDWLDDDSLENADWNGNAIPRIDDGEYVVPVHAPKAPKKKPCPHNQQVLVDRNLQCARCGMLIMGTGMAQGRVANDGHVIPDPNPPQWATEHSPGASSKNPGGELAPHS